mmetsp:Transcript_1016/g.1258  ORF Transcript_1016/g.1258 Transcript_1016/m.1258 type:complete len:208 (-) Transcript_1016:669-1292(-)
MEILVRVRGTGTTPCSNAPARWQGDRVFRTVLSRCLARGIRIWILGAAIHGGILIATVYRGRLKPSHRSKGIAELTKTRLCKIVHRKLHAHAYHVPFHVEGSHCIEGTCRAKGGATPAGGNLKQPAMRLDVSWINYYRPAEAGSVLRHVVVSAGGLKYVRVTATQIQGATREGWIRQRVERAVRFDDVLVRAPVPRDGVAHVAVDRV